MRVSSRALLLGSASLALVLSGRAEASALFTPGDLVVSVEGNGSNSAAGGTGNTGADANAYQDNQAAPLTLYEFATSGTNQTPVTTMELPQNTVGGNSAISGEYGSSSEAGIELSGNGEYLTLMGYGVNAAAYNHAYDLNGTGTALAQSCSLSSVASCAGVPQEPRVVAEIGNNGSVNTSTVLYNVFNENNPRSVATENGTTFYISGQGVSGDTTEGLFETTLGASSATAINTTYDTRFAEIYNGQLYVGQDSKVGAGQLAFIASVGAAGSLPTGATAPVILRGLSTGSKKSADPGEITLNGTNGNSVNGSAGSIFLSPEEYFFADATTLYVADGGDPKAGGDGDGGLQKWSLVGSTWELDYTLSDGLDLISNGASCADNDATSCTTGLEGLTGEVVDGEVELFATNYTLNDLNETFLYEITDTLSDMTDPDDESFTELAQAPADTNFKGVAFAPVPEPGSLAAFAAALFGLAAVRRRARS